MKRAKPKAPWLPEPSPPTGKLALRISEDVQVSAVSYTTGAHPVVLELTLTLRGLETLLEESKSLRGSLARKEKTS